MVVMTLALAMLAGCVTSPGADDENRAQEHDGVEIIVSNLDVPWSVAFMNDTAFVSERDSARILEVGPSGEPRVVATIEGVAPRGEAGLLGIAVHRGYLYAYYSTPGDNRVERFLILGGDEDGGSLTLGPAETIIDGIPVAGNHNGGRIAFGPDGMLYVTTGDAGDPLRSQDMESLGGKILRMTSTGEVPTDNPFPRSPVFTLGHRNPQGIAWAADGTMFASEFGQNTWDELNIIEAGSNYGWPDVEGKATGEAADTRFTDPVQQWPTSDASPSGIAIAAGAKGEETIFIANLRGQRLREVSVADPSGRSVERFVGEYGRLRAATVAPDGRLWILTNNTDGRGQPAVNDDRILVVQ